MKMCKTVPVFILLFTGYICNNRDVAANTTTSSYSVSPASSVTQAPELETPQHGNNHIPENHPLAAPTVAGISISFVFICMLITIGICCAQRKSKGFSAESNSAPSGEPEVSLKKISTHENQPWVTSPTRADADYLAVKTTCELGITCATYGLRHAPTTLSVWFMVLWFHCMLLSRETDRPCMPMGPWS
ncbi:uncharacterized protein LOC118452794 isoform X1 [Egretta garzetta]|uniref:uncharacterized protein LOC118452794 isoform X1 n=1 Tax=Egretta garzetta TaxID=188379 RepID=UPI00163CEAD8|nr:uncharacterized protein LOC118452794 isoform X1 [Egretta garzetta]